MHIPTPTRLLLSAVLLALAGCTTPDSASPPEAAPPLREATRGAFRIGTAVNAAQIRGEDRMGVALVERHFDSLTPENAMKWQHLQPRPGRFEFDLADELVEFGRKRGIQVVGHTLMWHSQTPRWVFENADGSEVSRDELLRRLREHIRTVVGRYRGKIHGWDVVNEAIRDEDGQLRTDKPWYRILGEEGIFAAFEAAHEADPDAELYYNDYSVENPVKRAGIIRLVRAIRARGLRIDGVGSQGHFGLDWPTLPELEQSIVDLADAGFKVHFTELDITVLPRPADYFGAEISKVFAAAPELDPYRAGLTAEMQQTLAERYAACFAIFARHRDKIERVTIWGVHDGMSWLNGWPIRGRADHPLLFDREGRAKPAVAAIHAVLANENGVTSE